MIWCNIHNDNDGSHLLIETSLLMISFLTSVGEWIYIHIAFYCFYSVEHIVSPPMAQGLPTSRTWSKLILLLYSTLIFLPKCWLTCDLQTAIWLFPSCLPSILYHLTRKAPCNCVLKGAISIKFIIISLLAPLLSRQPFSTTSSGQLPTSPEASVVHSRVQSWRSSSHETVLQPLLQINDWLNQKVQVRFHSSQTSSIQNVLYSWRSAMLKSNASLTRLHIKHRKGFGAFMFFSPIEWNLNFPPQNCLQSIEFSSRWFGKSESYH